MLLMLLRQDVCQLGIADLPYLQRFQRGQHTRCQRIEGHHAQQPVPFAQRDTRTVVHQQIRPMHFPQQAIEGVRQVTVHREAIDTGVLGNRLEPRML